MLCYRKVHCTRSVQPNSDYAKRLALHGVMHRLRAQAETQNGVYRIETLAPIGSVNGHPNINIAMDKRCPTGLAWREFTWNSLNSRTTGNGYLFRCHYLPFRNAFPANQLNFTQTSSSFNSFESRNVCYSLFIASLFSFCCRKFSLFLQISINA